MFGYVYPNHNELKVKEFELFKAYYCGLCKSIKNNYGQIPRFALNYDMTFLAILLDSLNDGCPKLSKERCYTHPLKKKPFVIDNKDLSYAAFCNVALTYFKLIDDKEDDKSISSALLSIPLKGYFKKFPKEYESMVLNIENNLRELSKLEVKNVDSSLDQICHPFADLTGNLLSINKSSDENLYNLGYNLGKWIYLIDAFDDLEKDMKKNKFNPLNEILNKENKSFEEFKDEILPRVEFNLTTCARLTFESFNNLDIKKNKPILENTLTLGLITKMDKVLGKNNNCKECN